MTTVTARLKSGTKFYEIKVDLDEALKIQQGTGDIVAALDSPGVYHDVDKGDTVSQSDLNEVFGTTNIHEVAEQIIKKGEVQKTQDFRDSEKEKTVKQLLDLLLRNATDQNGNPYTEDRLRRALQESGYNITNQSAEHQLNPLLDKLKEIIPIKIETKKVKITIPAQYTGQAYGLLKDYKESENWLSNGNLEATLNIPSGMQLDFYDKINAVTHGAIQTEEINEE